MNNKNTNSTACLTTLSMFYICIMISSELLVSKPVNMPIGITTAATFIFPLWFILNDIIAEVYGYKECRYFLLLGFSITFIFNLICFYFIKLPSPIDWKYQPYLDFTYGSLLRIEMSTFIAFMVSGFINIRLLTKWKILMSGKYFWLRSVGSSAVAEIIYSSINVLVVFLGKLPISHIPIIMFWSYILKLLYTLILAYPAMLIVQLIKKIDKVDVYDSPESLIPTFKYKETAKQILNI
jgi:hypothetical protein